MRVTVLVLERFRYRNVDTHRTEKFLTQDIGVTNMVPGSQNCKLDKKVVDAKYNPYPYL